MKQIIFSLMLIATALTSCGPKSHAPVPFEITGYSLVSKEVDGELLRGLVYNRTQDTIVPIEYFMIERGPVNFIKTVTAIRNGHKDLYHLEGEKLVSHYIDYQQLANGAAMGSVFGHKSDYFRFEVENADGKNIVAYIPTASEKITDDYLGPFKEFYPGLYGYIFEKDGSYSFMRVYNWNCKPGTSEIGQYDPKLLLEGYEKIFEITEEWRAGGSYPIRYSISLLAFKDGKWQIFDLQGKEKTNQRKIRELQSLMKKAEPIKMVRRSLSPKFQISGNENVGIAVFHK